MKVFVKLAALLTGKRAVVLTDTWGREYITLEQTAVGGNWAHVYPFTRVGQASLRADGTSDGPSSYIKQWRYL